MCIRDSVTAEGLAESALRNVALLEKYDFDDIVISLKSSDVKMNFDAYRLVDERSDYPLHIGVTEAGTLEKMCIRDSDKRAQPIRQGYPYNCHDGQRLQGRQGEGGESWDGRISDEASQDGRTQKHVESVDRLKAW